MELRTRRLQTFLNEVEGAELAVDGKLGPLTMGAIEEALGVDKPPETKPKYEFDERTEGNLETLDRKAEPTMRKLVGLAKKVAEERGVDVRVISGNRTWAEQDALYAGGRTKPGRIVTNARGGYSNHNFGIAIDFGIFDPATGKYLDGGTAREKRLAAEVHEAIAHAARHAGLDTEWGGDWRSFKDYPHHEIATGLSMPEKRRRYLHHRTVFS